jgi:hypothetical protein
MALGTHNGRQDKTKTKDKMANVLSKVCNKEWSTKVVPDCATGIARCVLSGHSLRIGGCIQKFPDWPPGAGTANGTALCY